MPVTPSEKGGGEGSGIWTQELTEAIRDECRDWEMFLDTKNARDRTDLSYWEAWYARLDQNLGGRPPRSQATMSTTTEQILV